MKRLMLATTLLATLSVPALANNTTINGPAYYNNQVHNNTSQSVDVRNTNNNHNAATSNSRSRSNAEGGSSAATINQSRDRLQAPSIGVPSIAVGNNCGLAASAGGSAIGFSFGGSVAWEGETCKRIALAFSLKELGLSEAALALLCREAEVKAAMAAAGNVCPGAVVTTNALVVSGSSTARATNSTTPLYNTGGGN